jgi:hypothetical protein
MPPKATRNCVRMRVDSGWSGPVQVRWALLHPRRSDCRWPANALVGQRRLGRSQRSTGRGRGVHDDPRPRSPPAWRPLRSIVRSGQLPGRIIRALPRDGAAWSELAYLLESDVNGGKPTATAISSVVGGDDYGVGGPGPDALVLPADIELGACRLCTENARDAACAQLVVG